MIKLNIGSFTSNTLKTDTVNESSLIGNSSAAAKWRLLVDRLAGIYCDIGWCIRCRSRTDSCFYLGSHRDKCLFHICCILCTCLQERNAQLVSIFLRTTNICRNVTLAFGMGCIMNKWLLWQGPQCSALSKVYDVHHRHHLHFTSQDSSTFLAFSVLFSVHYSSAWF